MGFDSLVLRLVSKNTKFLDSCVAVFETFGNNYDPFRLMVAAQILSVATPRVIQCLINDFKLLKFCPAPLLQYIIYQDEYRALVQENEDANIQVINIARRKLYYHRGEVLFWEKIRKRVVDKIFVEPKITYDFNIEKFIEDEKNEFLGKFIVETNNDKVKFVNIDEPENYIVTYESYIKLLRMSNTPHNFDIPDYILSSIKNDDILELRQYFEKHDDFVKFIKGRAKNNINNFNEWIKTQNVNDLPYDFLDVIPRHTQMYEDLAKKITVNDSYEMLHYICSEYRYSNKILLDIFTKNIDYENIAKKFMMVPQIYLFKNTDLANLIYENTKKMKVTNDLLLLFELFGINHGKTMVVDEDCIWTGSQRTIERHPIKINKYITRKQLSKLMKNYKKGDPMLDNIRDKYSLFQNKETKQLFKKLRYTVNNKYYGKSDEDYK